LARLNVHSEKVRNLVETKIAPLFLVSGSIAGLTKRLNETLAATGSEDMLHPNRLHTLLSDDLSRGVNEASLALIDVAATKSLTEETETQTLAAKRLVELRAKAMKLRQFGGATHSEIGRQLSLPPAIVKLVLPEATETSEVTSGVDHLPPATGQNRTKPDWSYQDAAVSRCLAAFDRSPTACLGLVLPTGGGKTRTALRTVLEFLARKPLEKGLVYWVTHRKNLRSQAHRELQKLKGTPQVLPENASALANRIKFIMLSELPNLLSPDANRPALIVIDEAHHAAASSYQLALNPPWPIPVLALTATPNRGDRLPIGVDQIAFNITYRELADRGAILSPTFLDFPVENFDWSEAVVGDLADYIIDRTEAEFTKVLVLAPRVERVEEFYAALTARLAVEPGHPLDEEDIGYVHGAGNSLGIDNEDFLARFGAKPRAVLVSAQLLLEGFDDPSINTVVLTYPSSSVIRLMQAAGRCVRYAPDKQAAYVVQARNDDIAYHFDQRWLYQEIDDVLRPELLDIDYTDPADLRTKIASTLSAHKLDAASADRIKAHAEALLPGDTCRLFLYGLPYFGSEESFSENARWGGILETPESSSTIRSIFNAFCAIGADLSDPTDFLARECPAHGFVQDFTPGSLWMQFSGLLTAAFFAKREVYGPVPVQASKTRPYRRAGPTTWLKYVTFHYRPIVPPALAAFLEDCHNRTEVEAAYLLAPEVHAAIKVPLPLGGAEAYLVDGSAFAELEREIQQIRDKLATAKPCDQFGVLASHLAGVGSVKAPLRLMLRIEHLLSEETRAMRTLVLTPFTQVI